jgi:2-dehydro-3-deoxyphosphogluconate aldolase / (4S)-4-hydroxy-2-oxoglutarate aldolase
MTYFRANVVLAIVRFREPGDLDGTLDALVEGGIRLLEITLDTPGALAAVERASSVGRSVGAGTVVTAEQVQACADAGAGFVVSPGLVLEVVEAAARLGIEAVPGVFTPTEVQQASSHGAQTVKLFPASLGGPDYLRALRGPFPTIRLVPTGGVGIDETSAYLAAGATAVGLGGALVGSAPPASQADLDAIAARASRAVEIAAGARSDPP